MADGGKISDWLQRLFGRSAPAPATGQALELHRLLYLLLPALEAQGFALSPDRYLRLLRLLQELPPEWSSVRAKNLLCPILATDPEQQRLFHQLFDQYLAALAPADAPEPEPEKDIPDSAEKTGPPPSSETQSGRPPKAPEPRKAPAESRPLVAELDECTEPPFSWNIVPEQEELPIAAGPHFSRTLTQLRRRETADHLVPDLHASIRATIRAGGAPELRYRTPTRPSEYLLLVERHALDDHRAALFDHFYRTLQQKEVLIERYFYQGDLRRCFNERHPAGLTLPQLRYRHPDARLLVVGAGYRLLSPRTGEPAEWLRPLYGWRRRILLTPVSRLQWGQREHALQTLFTLLPASLHSLHYLSDAPDEMLHGGYDALPEYVRRIAEVAPLDLAPPYLPRLAFHFDPPHLCWIAACAIYPALHFELTLRLGRLLSDPLGADLLDAASLLTLARLPWFTEGRIPQDARTELLEWLEYSFPAQHRLALDYLQELMEHNPPPEGSVAWAEYRINLALMELARTPQPAPETLAQLRTVIKRLDRPQRRGDFALPRHWEALLTQAGFAPEPPPAPEPEMVYQEELFYPGMVFAERFELEALIGKGGFGQVWQVRLLEPESRGKTQKLSESPAELFQDGLLSALKIFTGGERYYDYCVQEFKQASRLGHPNILRMHDCGMWNGYPWQSMPLHRPIAPAREWQEAELWRLLRDIAHALNYLHTQRPPVTHNDIKPGQFLQNEDGAYLLGDLGISGKLLETAARDIRPTVDVNFLAPEALKDLYFRSKATDIYALGASLYFLATGAPPRPYGSAPLNAPAPLPMQYSGELNALLMDCLSPEPAARPDAQRLRRIAEARVREFALRKDIPEPAPTSVPLPAMVLIPAGTFEMGDVLGDNESEAELPVHTVALDAFYLGAFAVTFDEYDAYCEATGREKPKDEGWGRGRRPVINVNWYDAVEYCNWLSAQHGYAQVYTISGNEVSANWEANGYRLPTEAEWEYAAREGGKKVRFGNGKDIADPKEINFDGDRDDMKPYSVVGQYRRQTVPVDDFAPNALGLYQMSGNVWEWCWDWYGVYAPGKQSNPKGPVAGSYRICRGGSWGYDPASVRVASRGDNAPDLRFYSRGFRLARRQ